MSVTGNEYRTLGMTVPVSEVLNPSLWRARMAAGTPAGLDPAGQVVAPASTPASLCALAAQYGVTAGDVQAAVGSLSDDTIRWHLRAALSELEVKLGMPLGIQVVKTPPIDDGLVQGRDYDRVGRSMPYNRTDQANWYRLDLPESSVISIQRVRAVWFGQTVWQLDVEANPDLVHLEWGTQGIAHILPNYLKGLLITNDGTLGNGTQYGVWYTINAYPGSLPDFWRFDYTIGPVPKYGDASSAGQIETILAHWCYAAAGQTLFSLSGLVTSKGLTSASVSMDGVSRSIGLQASAIYGINSAFEEMLKRITERIDWKKLRTYKRGMAAYGLGA